MTEEEYPPDQLPDELEQKFLSKVKNAESLEEANWLTTLASSLEDWEWSNASFQGWIVVSEYGHHALINSISKHYSKWLNDAED